MSRTISIAGSGTDVGKTWVACRLIQDLRAGGLAVTPRKPVVSGVDDDDVGSSDTDRLIDAAGLGLDQRDAISPWRFIDPVAPNEAARRVGVVLDFDAIVAACAINDSDVVVVETAGGVMSPLTDDTTQLSLLDAVNAPVLLVVDGRYLGWISHTLTALFALRAAELDVVAVVVNRGLVAALTTLTSIAVVNADDRAAIADLARGALLKTPTTSSALRRLPRQAGRRID